MNPIKLSERTSRGLCIPHENKLRAFHETIFILPTSFQSFGELLGLAINTIFVFLVTFFRISVIGTLELFSKAQITFVPTKVLRLL